MLKALAAGKSFGRLCERLAGGTSPLDVAYLLPRSVQRGWITGFSLARGRRTRRGNATEGGVQMVVTAMGWRADPLAHGP